MAPLDVLQTVVTPMLRLGVRFAPATPAPAGGYRVTAEGPDINGTPHTVTAVVSRGYATDLGPLVWDAAYSVQVESLDGARDPVAAGPGEAFVARSEATWPNCLRQSLCDILHGAGIVRGGTPLVVVRDRLGLADTLASHKVLPGPGPFAEVWPSTLASSEPAASMVRRVETYRVPIRVAVKHTDTAAATELIMGLWARVKQAIDATPNLNLGSAGVCGQSWRWSVEPRSTRARGDLVAWRGAIDVTVQTLVGAALLD